MVCMSSYPPRAADAPAPGLADGGPAQHRLVRRLRGDAAGGAGPDRRRGAAPPAREHRAGARAGRRGGAARGRRIRWRRCSTSPARTAWGTSHRPLAPARGGGSCSGARSATAPGARGGRLRRARGRVRRGRGARHDAAAKLLLAQAPLAVGAGRWWRASPRSLHRGARARRSAGASSQDNYRSVLAAQRMKEAIERIDSARALPRRRRARARRWRRSPQHRRRFEQRAEGPGGQHHRGGRGGATRALRRAWTRYRAELRSRSSPPLEIAPLALLRRAPARFPRGKDAADEILALNQDAMVRKSDQAPPAQRAGRDAVVVGECLRRWCSGFSPRRGLTIARAAAARRARPGGAPARRRATARSARIGEAGGCGDRPARRGFNAMAEQPAALPQSSLGELLQAQQASQAAIDSLPDPVIVFEPQGEVSTPNRAAEADARPSRVGRGPAAAAASGGPRASRAHARRTCWPARRPRTAAGLEEALRVDVERRQPLRCCRAQRRSTATRGSSWAPRSCSRTSRGCAASTS